MTRIHMIKFTKFLVYETALVAVTAAGISCNGKKNSDKQFTLIEPSHSGVYFSNDLTETAQFNLEEYLYFYNGGGVAVGDINNDGLKDLFFTSNQSANKLYLNKGDFVFEDISKKAGIDEKSAWSTGVAMADVNGDGYLDIYVCQLGDFKGIKGRNRLYVNNGGDGMSFTEKAGEYGLSHVGFSTQASFFDYDNDGDLDMYLLNHSDHYERNFDSASIRLTHDPKGGDKLYRNDSVDGKIKFTDVTREAGIYNSSIGYGLGVAVADLNLDGCPDIYVCNDFHENDYVYINNCDGTFNESVETSMGHTSHSSMGVDAADFNNDGLPDIVVLDMLPEDERILKKSLGEESDNVYNTKIRFGYHPQLARNTLQLNQGDLKFSEVALLSDVYATDWSWSPLLCDLDNDGYKDLYITNGIVKRPNDLDFIKYKWQLINTETRNRSKAAIDTFLKSKPQLNITFIEKMPSEKISNKVYRNNGDLTFADKSIAWGMDEPVFSTGAAYADLDNDGDLDIVLNNINHEASIYRNNSQAISRNNYFQIQLTGSGKNTRGLGAKVILKAGGNILYQEQMPVRGFLSTVDEILHFGIGQHMVIDTLQVIWPDKKMQILTNVAPGKLLSLDQRDALLNYRYPESVKNLSLFEDISGTAKISYHHKENEFQDYDWQFLIPHKLSTQGPKLAIGDANGDGLDDVYCGGASYQAGQLFLQKPNGTFVVSKQADFEKDSVHEDVGVAFFDADGDGDLDLYAVSGGNEWSITGEHLEDRLYINDGKGNFHRSSNRIPATVDNGSCVRPQDFDGDGDIDLFVGSRSVINGYGVSPKSRLLRNDGSGVFRDVIDDVAPALARTGMVTDAVWVDIDKDERPDLIVVGEWMPISVFKNTGSGFIDITGSAGLIKSNGWWNCVTALDVDGDGDQDLIAGNLGLNAKIKASPTEPATLFIKDFDNNGAIDQIMCFYKNGISTPFATKDELVKQIPSLQKKFPTYDAYSRVQTVYDIFTQEELEGADVKYVYTFESSYIENLGNGTFQVHALPLQAQFSPVFAVFPGDFDEDQHPDLLLGGNFFGATVNFGRYDASYGVFLKGNGKGNFLPVPFNKSGWLIDGEVRDIQRLVLADKSVLLLLACNNAGLKIFKQRRTNLIAKNKGLAANRYSSKLNSK